MAKSVRGPVTGGTVVPDSAPQPSRAPSALITEGAFSTAGQFGPGAMPRRREQRVVYAVPCYPDFRSAVLTLAKARELAVAELVRMVLALVSPTIRAGIPDPGEPGREGTTLGTQHNRRPTLIPTLVLRLAPGLDHVTIRRALALALAFDDPKSYRLIREDEYRNLVNGYEKLEYRNRALIKAIDRLAFRPQARHLNIGDATAILGLSRDLIYDEQVISKRFRELAPIFHPDTGVLPCRERMGRLIEARNLLVGYLRRLR